MGLGPSTKDQGLRTNQYDDAAWTVDAQRQRQFDVCRSARSGDEVAARRPSDVAGALCEELAHRRSNVVLANDAEMNWRKQRSGTRAALAGEHRQCSGLGE